MPSLNRRGFTLVELLVALVLLGIVTTAIYRVLVNNQRMYQSQTQRIDLQQNIRAAATILPAEFRELNAFDGDIKGMWVDSIQIRALRQFGVVCVAPVLNGAAVNGKTLVLRNEMLTGSRAFLQNDSVFVFDEGNDGTRADDGWALGRVTANPTAVNCPDVPPRPGTQLNIDFAAFAVPIVNAAGAIPVGSPVRGFEIVTYKIYQAADGLWYLGLRTPTNALQPLVGPLTGSTGLRLNYYDAAGAVTAVATNVAQIEIIVRGRTAQAIQLPSGGRVTPVDSVVTRVALRNNRRW
ncbi:MAG TPA: prepilin-type N-terminal cleavage/methylation domain-containing protein [Gemmatimonadales bacterium]|nr:prepilin-type N-terminal cleavage/methylation domain-containing protein [Gemmatimonadales bacterium]